MATTTYTLEYNVGQTGGLSTPPTFNYAFPQSLSITAE